MTLEVLQADPVIEVSDHLLSAAHPSLISVRDGIMTIHAINATLHYGLRDHDDIRETWIGVRSGYDDETA